MIRAARAHSKIFLHHLLIKLYILRVARERWGE